MHNIGRPSAQVHGRPRTPTLQQADAAAQMLAGLSRRIVNGSQVRHDFCNVCRFGLRLGLRVHAVPAQHPAHQASAWPGTGSQPVGV